MPARDAEYLSEPLKKAHLDFRTLAFPRSERRPSGRTSRDGPGRQVTRVPLLGGEAPEAGPPRALGCKITQAPT